jgi:hypothetical protein
MPRSRYDQLVDVGIYGPEDRVELLDGLHATAVALVRAALEKAFGRTYYVREKKPIALDERSEPEPDVVVVPGRPRDYRDAHPSHPCWSSRSPTRRSRSTGCARAPCTREQGSPTTGWSNLIDEVLEVYREPVRASSAHGDSRYDAVRLLRRNAVVTPLGAPRARIRVAALLP